MATLTLTNEQLRLVQDALDFYSRIGIGQFNRILEHPSFVQKIYAMRIVENKCDEDNIVYHLREARNLITGLTFGLEGSWGIFNPQVDESCRVAYDIIQVIRHEFWKAQENASQHVVSSSVNLSTQDSDKIKCKLNG